MSFIINIRVSNFHFSSLSVPGALGFPFPVSNSSSFLVAVISSQTRFNTPPPKPHDNSKMKTFWAAAIFFLSIFFSVANSTPAPYDLDTRDNLYRRVLSETPFYHAVRQAAEAKRAGLVEGRNYALSAGKQGSLHGKLLVGTVSHTVNGEHSVLDFHATAYDILTTGGGGGIMMRAVSWNYDGSQLEFFGESRYPAGGQIESVGML